ncbi:MAG: hypothetical protein ACK4UY_09150 [Dietzia sp.]
MTKLTPTLALTLLATLTGCSSAGTVEEQSTTPPQTSNEASDATRGAVELAVSQTCAPGSDPQCIPFYGEHILVESSAFERAGVDLASSDPSSGELDMITVQLASDGTEVVRRMTAEALQGGDHARLVMKVGDDVISAVRVQGELHGDHLQVALPPDAPTEDILANLNGTAE